MSSSPGGCVEELVQHTDTILSTMTIEWLLKLVLLLMFGTLG